MPARVRPAYPSDVAFGVTSRNAVDAVLALARRHRRRLMLIASRAQVEGERFGGGYVEGWDTVRLVNYVRERDPGGNVIVCRDHGGPWQHAVEAGSPEPEAMASSLRSLREDIAAGVEILHIDTSRDHSGPASLESAICRLIALYRECHEYARTMGRHVLYEIGFEEQSADIGEVAEFDTALMDVADRLTAESLPLPTFVVAQTGTKVVELENRGAIVHDPGAVRTVVRHLAGACGGFGARLKAHNVDYLGEEALRALVDGGVDAVNVAPELGVAETRALLRLLTAMRLTRQRDAFLELAYDCEAWRKWLAPQSAADDLHRCVMAGHYVFGTAEFKEIKKEVRYACDVRGADLDDCLRQAVEAAMLRYLRMVNLTAREDGKGGRR